MSGEEDANSILTLMVLEEAQVVTYRKLSRELQVHVNVAKQQLASFFEKNQSKCHATYLVTGTVEGSGFMVKLVPASQVAEAQKGIGSSTCHIYSVEPHKLEDPNVLVTANLTTGSIRDTLDLGAVGSSVTQVTADPKNPSTEQPAKSAIPVPAAPVKKEKSKDSKSFFGHSIVKYATPQEDKEEEGASSQQPSPQPAKPANPEKTAKQTKPNKSVKQEKEEENAAMDVDTQEVDTSTSRVEDMFDDDFDIEPSNQQQPKTADTQDTFDSVGDSQGQPIFSDDSQQQQQQQQPSTSDSNGRMRKRRKITREKHTKNSRGMLVTEFVEEWESCSGSEPEDETTSVKKKPAAPTTNTSKGGKKASSAGNQQQQSSLLRFFGKK